MLRTGSGTCNGYPFQVSGKACPISAEHAPVMRVLSVGFMYPPHHHGGYELTWQVSVEALRQRGHHVRVLCADWRRPQTCETDTQAEDVHRELHTYWRDHAFPRLGLRARVQLERHNARALQRHLDELAPDVVNWWPIGSFSMALIEQAHRRSLPAVGVINDDWLRYGARADQWTRMFARAAPLGNVAERVLSLPARADLDGAAHWIFNSEYTRTRAATAALTRTSVAHPGVDRHLFAAAPRPEWRWRLLYVGRLDERKGVDTIVSALPLLPPEATLRIVGSGDEAYRLRLLAQIGALGLGERIRLESLERAQLPGAYAQADVVVFPSRWEEPWGLVGLEAMAVGAPLAATAGGGSAEYLRDGENCLTFPPDDPLALADRVRRLAGDADLRSALEHAGHRTAERYPESAFTDAVVTAIERAA